MRHFNKALLSFACTLWASMAFATDATDQISISIVSVDPGAADSTAVIVSLNTSATYTAYEMDITLPAGLEIPMNSSTGKYCVQQVRGTEGIYPYSVDEYGDKTYSHNFTFSYNVIGPNVLRVSCLSLSGENFTSGAGQMFKFYVKAEPYARPGDKDFVISNLHLIDIDAVQTTPADPNAQINVTVDATIPISVSATNTFSTCVLPFDYATMPSNLEAYEISMVSDTLITLTKSESMAAFTPYILYSKTGYAGNFCGTDKADEWVSSASKGELTGVLEATALSEGYIMQNQGEGAMFYPLNGHNFSLPAGKCYLTLDGNARYVKFQFFSDEEDGIKATTADDTNIIRYNLMGMPISTPAANSIYIQNGKKVLNRQ